MATEGATIRVRRGSPSFLLAAAGVTLLLASAAMRWFTVPKDLVPAGRLYALSSAEAPATYAFKGACLLVAGGLAFVALRRPSPRRDVARLASALLALLLLFPHAVMVWCPSSAARASWFEAQHASFVWDSGDVWEAAENKKLDWKGRLYPADMLEDADVMRTPALSPRARPFDSLRDLMIWFGYSSAFCLFARLGWLVAMVGSALLLVGACRGHGDLHLPSVRLAGRTFARCLAGGMGAALVPALLCGWLVERGRDAAEQGRLAAARDWLARAEVVLPMVAMNTDFVDEAGVLDERLGRPTPQAAFHHARALVQRSRLEEGEDLFASLVADPSEPPVVRREAVRALLRRGTRELNAGETSAAIQVLQGVLARDACNLKASYALQLAYLRAGRFDAVDDLAARVRAVYGAINAIDKVSVLGAVQENVLDAAYLRGDLGATLAARQLLADPSRLKKEP
jgi:hypothetical protein